MTFSSFGGEVGSVSCWSMAVSGSFSPLPVRTVTTLLPCLIAPLLICWKTPAKEAHEPGSCASLAGVFQQIKSGAIKQGSKVVTVLTGNGLKDPETAIDQQDTEPTSPPNDEKVITDYIANAVKL